jgi:hypothetical protein
MATCDIPSIFAQQKGRPIATDFILIDLQTQMPYLPEYMRTWSRERLLDWMRQFGEVHQSPKDEGWYSFRSWVGRWASFVLSEAGELYIPGTYIRAWDSSTNRP